MRILYSWLKDFIDINLTPKELEQKFTLLGIETEGVEVLGANFDGVTAAKVVAMEQHPNADKLRLVTVDTGGGKTMRVVCGAPNVEIGMITAFAKVGARLPLGVLEKATIRGVESLGMLCSYKELGIMGDSAGIISFDKTVKPGTDIASLYGEPDYIFDLEITPNKPEFLSHYGIARALAILLKIPLNTPLPKQFDGTFESIPTSIKDITACDRYIGRTMKNINNAQSPEWMKKRLKAMNSNPKNALVDITNYVLFEFGYPLHIFDLDIISGPEINIRFAQEGEKFTTLMGDEIVLDDKTLLIADASEPLALAGIMGGKKSGVTENTKNIFLEAAHFNPELINITSRKLGIKSESSYRFERATDIEAAYLASNRAAELLVECCADADTEISVLNDNYPVPVKHNSVFVVPGEINELLGTEFSEGEIFDVLKALQPCMDINKTDVAGVQGWAFTAPSYRPDIKTKWDIAEEVAVFLGYDRIPSDNRPVTVEYIDMPRHKVVGDLFLDALVGFGFCEAYNYDFISEYEYNLLGLPQDNAAKIENPLSEEWKYLRPSLIPGLLRTAQRNKSRGEEEIFMCELGRAYNKIKSHYSEQLHFSGIMTGKWPSDVFWKHTMLEEINFYHVKGIIASLFYGISDVVFEPSKQHRKYMHPKICADIIVKNTKVGYFGKIHPLAAQDFDLQDVFVFEINAEAFSKKIDIRNIKLKPVSNYPQAWRDLSFVVADKVTYGEIEHAIAKTGGHILQSVSLTDMYKGANIEENKKSVTVRLVFGLNDRTLQDSEVEGKVQDILSVLGEKFSAALR